MFRAYVVFHSAQFACALWFERRPHPIMEPAGAWKSRPRFRPEHGKESALPYKGIIDPPQLAMLTAALDAYCQMAGIQKGTHQHEQASLLILSMYRRGANTAKAMAVAMENLFRGEPPLENDW